MATDFNRGPLGEFRAASGAGGGTALSTAAAFIQLPKGTHHVFLTPRNFAGGALVAQVAFNPWLTVLKTADNLLTPPIDYSENAQDGSTDTDIDLSSFNTLANGDFLLVGSHLPFRGVSIDVDATMSGSNSPALTVSYWNGSAWVSASATDGTSSGSKTMAVDGTVTWTVPAAWKAASLMDIFSRVGPAVESSLFNRANLAQVYAEVLYWTRWEVDAQLNDTTVTLNSMLAMNRSTVKGELLASLAPQERRVHRGFGGIGCIEATSDQGTGNLIVNVDSGNGGRFA